LALKPPPGPGSSPPPLRSPSSIATSSRTKIDDLPFFAPPKDPVILSLAYASDTELIDALLIDRPKSRTSTSTRGIVSPYNTKWSSTVDPAFAFLALRDRGSFPTFIENIGTDLRRIWKGLTVSGMHQILASDLLLRNSDPRVLREVLELDAGTESKLRHNIVASMYREVLPHINARRVKQISRPAMFNVAEALMAKTTGPDPKLLTEIWTALYTSSTEGDSPKSLLAITLNLVSKGEVEGSVKMIKQLAEVDRVSFRSTEKVDPGHPELVSLSVLGIVLRTALESKFGDLARDVVEEMLETMKRSEISASTYKLVLGVCRWEILTLDKGSVNWACGTLIKLSSLDTINRIPSSLVSEFIDIASDGQLHWFMSTIDPLRRDPPTPAQILRLAKLFPRDITLDHLLIDIDRTPTELIRDQQVDILRILINTRRIDAVRKYYRLWSSSTFPPRLDAATVVALVQTFHKSDIPHDRNMIRKAMSVFKSTCTKSTQDQFALAKANVLIEDAEAVWKGITQVNPTDYSVQLLTDNLMQKQPKLSMDITNMAIEKGMTVNRPFQNLLAACAAGEWHVLRKDYRQCVETDS
jgi:hypothetical protein